MLPIVAVNAAAHVGAMSARAAGTAGLGQGVWGAVSAGLVMLAAILGARVVVAGRRDQFTTRARRPPVLLLAVIGLLAVAGLVIPFLL